ncbi:hypothetical protein ISX67_17300, partial [Vibrio parahaemolyticus]
YSTPREAELEIGHYMVFYNEERKHQVLNDLTLIKSTLTDRDTLHELVQSLKILAYVSNHWASLL